MQVSTAPETLNTSNNLEQVLSHASLHQQFKIQRVRWSYRRLETARFRVLTLATVWRLDQERNAGWERRIARDASILLLRRVCCGLRGDWKLRAPNGGGRTLELYNRLNLGRCLQSTLFSHQNRQNVSNVSSFWGSATQVPAALVSGIKWGENFKSLHLPLATAGFFLSYLNSIT